MEGSAATAAAPAAAPAAKAPAPAVTTKERGPVNAAAEKSAPQKRHGGLPKAFAEEDTKADAQKLREKFTITEPEDDDEPAKPAAKPAAKKEAKAEKAEENDEEIEGDEETDEVKAEKSAKAEQRELLLAKAKYLGVEDADSYEDDKELAGIVKHEENRLARQSQKPAPGKDEAGKTKSADGKGAKKAEAEEAEGEAKEEDFDVDAELKNPEDYDPKVISQFKKLNDHWAKKYESSNSQVAELKAQVESLVGEHRQAKRDATGRELDGLFSAPGDGFEDMFGEGSVKDLDPKSTEFKNRVAVSKEMQLIADVYASKGQSVPDYKTLFTKALVLLFPDKQKNQAHAEIQKQVRKQNGQFSARATSRQSADTRSPEDRARANTERMIEERGLSDD